jgi:glycosyltransferase involved in cell wall biosynthesis
MARILLLTHIYPPAIDGGSRVIAKIGDYFEKQGHQILVVTSNCTSSDDFVSTRRSRLKCDEDGHNIIRLPVITFLHRPLKLLSKIFPNFKTFSKGPFFSPISFFSVLISIFRFHPDYIIAGPLPTTITIYASLIHFLSTKIFHFSTKLLLVPCFHPNDPDFQTSLLLSTLKNSDYIWCLTNYEKEYFQKTLKINHPQYFVHGLGVATNFIIPKNKIKYPKNPNIVFIANFSAHKRTELLIQAFDLILKKYPSATLTLLGQKTLYFPNISNFLKSIPQKTKKNIKFIFNPSPEQIKNSIDQSSCLVLPSIHESFGLVFVESLARGKAIIGADTPQSSEVINKLRGGLTFETDDLNSLTKTITKLISSQKLSQKYALNGYQRVKDFYTWDRIGENLCQKLGI